LTGSKSIDQLVANPAQGESMIYLGYSILGALVGVLSGILGIGGGIVIIPGLIALFGLTQHQAQGTSVAMMVPPIGLLAAYKYYQSGNVVFPIAIFGAIGFFLGGYFGADIANRFSDATLRQVFGTFLIAIGLKMVLS